MAVFSPDGAHVLTASDDHTAGIWNPETGERTSILEGHGELVYSAMFSRDGARIVTASEDRTARVWDVETGATLSVLKGHGGPVFFAEFSPDGARIVTASDDRTARIWKNPTFRAQEVFAAACNGLGNRTDLSGVAKRYGLKELKPICGLNPPANINLSALND
jgi:WD40 repeat protein